MPRAAEGEEGRVKLYLVLVDGGGSHEPEAVVSLWTTRALAEDEVARLDRITPYVERFNIVEAEANVPGDSNRPLT